MFIDRQYDGNRSKSQQIRRIVQYRPIKLFPLRKELAAIRMLLLNHTNQNDLTSRTRLLQCGVPDWHVAAATRSPRREMDQQHFGTTELRKRHRLPRIDPWQYEVGMRLTNHWLVIRS